MSRRLPGRDERPCIALDVQFPRRVVDALRGVGFRVVQAQHGETDAAWFERALAASVVLILSPDSDLEILAYDHEIPFHRVPPRRVDMFDLVLAAWGSLDGGGKPPKPAQI